MDLQCPNQDGPRKTITGGHLPCGPSVCQLFSHAIQGFCRQISPRVTQTRFPPSPPSHLSLGGPGLGWESNSCFPAAWQSPPAWVGASKNSGGIPEKERDSLRAHPERQPQSWDPRPGPWISKIISVAIWRRVMIKTWGSQHPSPEQNTSLAS